MAGHWIILVEFKPSHGCFFAWIRNHIQSGYYIDAMIFGTLLTVIYLLYRLQEQGSGAYRDVYT